MIKIGNIKETKNVFVEYDLYIPIDIKIGERDNVSESILYWRIGDLKKTLVEIGIERNYKEIRSITLVICDKVYESEKIYNSFHSTIIGCPMLVINNLEERTYIDESKSVEIYFEKNNVYILFSKNDAKVCIINKNIEFLVDAENNWVGLCIKDITKENLNILRHSLS